MSTATATTCHLLHTADGIALDATWYGDEAAAAAPSSVVVVHGFTASKSHPAVIAAATALAAGGRQVLVYDSRGHGRSGGVCTLGELERLDVDAAVGAASERAAHVIVVGASMGGIAVINHLSAGGDASGAIVVSTPARWRVPPTPRGVLSVAVTQTRVGQGLASRLWRTRLARRPPRGPPPVERISDVRQPIVIIHGTYDRFVHSSNATSLHDAAPPPRSLMLVPGMEHGYCRAAVAPIREGIEWLEGRFAGHGAAASDDP